MGTYSEMVGVMEPGGDFYIEEVIYQQPALIHWWHVAVVTFHDLFDRPIQWVDNVLYRFSDEDADDYMPLCARLDIYTYHLSMRGRK